MHLKDGEGGLTSPLTSWEVLLAHFKWIWKLQMNYNGKQSKMWLELLEEMWNQIDMLFLELTGNPIFELKFLPLDGNQLKLNMHLICV